MLQALINQKLAHANINEIAHFLGYNKINSKLLNRFQHVCTSPDLGLTKSGYDFKYSSLEFLQALCRLLNIDIVNYQDEIQAIRDRYSRINQRFHSFVFVDTDFKREGQTINSLAVLEHYRRIYLDVEVQLKPVCEQVDFVKQLIAEHYHDCGGKIICWGKIKRYKFIYSKENYLVLSVDGQILSDEQGGVNQSTKLQIKGEDLSKIIPDM